MGILDTFKPGKKYNFKVIQRTQHGGITWVQGIGFALMVLGVLATMYCFFITGKDSTDLPGNDTNEGSKIAIAFFITMLGIAFAFPELLEHDKGQLSTMRIIVFMVTNVICMLLLKFGWAANSFDDIKVDAYWASIIGLVFGAKAAQSYFENIKGIAQKNGPTEPPANEMGIAALAKAQNEATLKHVHPNINSVSDTLDKNGKALITLYLTDYNTDKLPHTVKVTLPDGTERDIPAEIVAGTGKVKIQSFQQDNAINNGSICCAVTSAADANFKAVVTAGHVITKGHYKKVPIGTPVNINNTQAGKIALHTMNYKNDIAVVQLDSDFAANFPLTDKLFKGFYTINAGDLRKPAKLQGNVGKEINVYILDYNIEMSISYSNRDVYMRNLILVGNAPEKNDSKCPSQRGDSGGCIYDAESNKLIGIIIGGDEKFTYALPVEQTLTEKNYTLL